MKSLPSRSQTPVWERNSIRNSVSRQPDEDSQQQCLKTEFSEQSGSQIGIWELGGITLSLNADPNTSVEALNRTPGNFRLLQIYPNPFNAVTTIQFYLPKASNIRISVVNTNGRLVEVLKQGYAQEGLQTLEWAATGRASGVYSLVLESGGRKQVRAMSLIR